MEADPLEGSSYNLSELLNVEIELKVEEEDAFEHTATDFTDFPFADYEVTTDLTTGQPICVMCLEHLPQESVVEHMVTAHKYRKVAFKCWNCLSVFKERIMLTIHKQSCQPKKKKKVPLQKLIKDATKSDENICPICLIEIPDNLGEHMMKVHSKPSTTVVEKPNEQIHNCPICNKEFKSKMNATQHVRLVHRSVQDSVECSICGQKFSSMKYLANHTRNVHPTGDKVHKCEFCGKSFKSHQSLYQHNKNVHLGNYVKKKEMKMNKYV